MKILPFSKGFIESVFMERKGSGFDRDDKTLGFSGLSSLLEVMVESYSGIIWIMDKNGDFSFFETEGVKKHRFAEDFEKALRFLGFFKSQFSDNKDLKNAVEKCEAFNWQSDFEGVDFDNYLYPLPEKDSIIRIYVGISADISHKMQLGRLLKEAKEHSEKVYKERDLLLSRIFSEMPGVPIAGSRSFVLAQNKFSIWKKLEGFIHMSEEQLNINGINLEIYFDENLPNELVGDDKRFTQIIVNLVSSLLKLRTGEGTIGLYIDRGRNVFERQEVLLRAVSTMAETNEKVLDKMLAATEDGDSREKRDYINADLGLSVIRDIVEVMDGSVNIMSGKFHDVEIMANVWLKTKDDSDTEDFNEDKENTIETEKMDTYEVNEKAGNDKKVEQNEYSRYTVLVVDDIEINIDILSIMLESTGINIKTVDNGKEAFEAYRDNPDKFDLILMDINMPVMDGYDATKNIRKLEMHTGNRIPILAMSANFYQQEIENALFAGMDGYVSKPFELKRLLNEMGKFLNCAN